MSKFTPRESNQLQVPALLVHCIKEIEQRGLQEVGIYRLNVYVSIDVHSFLTIIIVL